METWSKEQRIEVPEEISDRADKVLASLIQGVSRTRIQQSFDAGRVWIDGEHDGMRDVRAALKLIRDTAHLPGLKDRIDALANE